MCFYHRQGSYRYVTFVCKINQMVINHLKALTWVKEQMIGIWGIFRIPEGL